MIANAPDAKTMVAMMNKNLAAYLTHYLKDVGLSKDFITRLVNRSIDPQFLHSMAGYTWNKDIQVLSTPEDAAREKEQDIKTAAWYKDKFGDHMKDKGRKVKEQYSALEQLYDLDGTHSVNTIFGKADEMITEGKGSLFPLPLVLHCSFSS